MDRKHSACGPCGQRASKRCSSCKNIQYCTLECQQADWAFHKVLCKSLAHFANRPHPDVRRAVYFPERGDKPHFIWLPVAYKELETFFCDADLGVPEREQGAEMCLPTDAGPVGKYFFDMLVCGKLRSGELLDHGILMMGSRSTLAQKPNQSLKRLVKQDIDPRFGLGPRILIGVNKVKQPQYTLDLDTSSFTLALDSIIGMAPPGYVALHAQKVQAVKANYTSVPSLEQIEIPKRHPIFKSGTQCAVADHHITPLKFWFYPASGATISSPASSSTTTGTTASNTKVLHLCVDPSSPDFGRIPTAMQADTRSMLVVRAPKHIDIGLDMAYFKKLLGNFEDKFVPWLTESQGGTPEDRLRGLRSAFAVSSEATREAFNVFEKLRALGMTDKEAEVSARAGVGLGPP